jgi:hypothetical protein
LGRLNALPGSKEFGHRYVSCLPPSIRRHHRRDAASRKADITTENGAVDATFAVAPAAVNVTAKDGAVDLSAPSGAGYDVTTHTTGTTPQVDVPSDRNAAHSLTVTTASGGIHIH